jgi:histidinol dehydrogenase
VFQVINEWSSLSAEKQSALIERPALIDDVNIQERASDIIALVKDNGDRALLDLTLEIEGRRLDQLRVSDSEFDIAEQSLAAESKAAIDVAIRNVRCFHEAQVTRDYDMQVSPGVRCERRSQPIDAVGLYVPAGSAPLPSAAIMMAVPSLIAGCPVRVLCSPVNDKGFVDAATLVAARRSGIDQVFKVGGAQAIAAMAYGTESVPKVDKIFGPGNAWVTAAKRLVSCDPRGAAIDMPAGPSEVLVIADEHANPAFVAADLLSQAEHGPDSQVILLTTDRNMAERAIAEIRKQLSTLSRKAIAEACLQHSRVILVSNLAEAIAISNRYAPEHLIIQTKDPRASLSSIRNAGSVFLGAWTPESVGDYCSGTNHVLPTYGAARSYSGLGVEQFMRQMTVQELTEAGLRGLAPTVVELAGLEGLDAHAAAVKVRLGSQAPQGDVK